MGCHEVDQDCDGYTTQGGDCDDTDSAVPPNAHEVQNDGIDQDGQGDDAAAFVTPAPCGCAAGSGMPIGAGLTLPALAALYRRRRCVPVEPVVRCAEGERHECAADAARHEEGNHRVGDGVVAPFLCC